MNQEGAPRRTPLCDLHVASGARMVEFAGWLMPVQYEGIIAEHRRVREAAGFFDLSHMGRLYVSGPDSVRFLQMLTTNDVARLTPGQIQYSLVCNHQGGVRDDVLVYRLEGNDYLLVVNASNREKLLPWMEEVKGLVQERFRSAAVSIQDRTDLTAMVGVQGPRSRDVLQPMTPFPLDGLGYYRSAPCSVLGAEALVSRTGYTGEDGFEVILPVEAGVRMWQRLTRASSGGEVVPAGLGARDTLRLEAAMPLYGHELDESINPLEAGLGRFVQLEKEYFVGRDALRAVALAGPRRRLIGLVIPDRAIARQGSPVMAGNENVGRVTSGSYSPTLDRSVALALVPSEGGNGHARFAVGVRGAAHEALVANLPFYRRKRG